MGRSDIYLKLEVFKKVYGVAVLIIAVVCFQSPLAIAGTGLITTWIGWLVNAYPNKRLIEYSYKEQFFDVFPVMVMTIIMFFIYVIKFYSLTEFWRNIAICIFI